MRVLAEDRFRPGILGGVVRSIETASKSTVQRSDLARAEALIRLRIAEEAVGRKAPTEVDREFSIANEKMGASVELNPADSLLWFMLYSVGTTHRGFDSTTVGYLKQSYITGPSEGWVALRRNRFALAAFPSLSNAMQARVVSEFCSMVDSEFTEIAALNFMGLGSVERDRLLESLSRTDIVPREKFARTLVRQGLTVSVPGVEIEQRIWRR